MEDCAAIIFNIVPMFIMIFISLMFLLGWRSNKKNSITDVCISDTCDLCGVTLDDKSISICSKCKFLYFNDEIQLPDLQNNSQDQKSDKGRTGGSNKEVGKRFEFNSAIYANSKFRYTKIDEKDMQLLRRLQIKDWNNKDVDEELTLKFSHWVISENRDMILKGLGGGLFEIPEMYDFVYRGRKVRIELGGGGDPSRLFKRYKDGGYDEEIIVRRIRIPSELSPDQDNIMANIAEAFAADGFRFSLLKKLSVTFPI